MGQAKLRGDREMRRREAIQRAKRALAAELGDVDPGRDNDLRSGLNAFLARLAPDEWARRRQAVVDALEASLQKLNVTPFIPVRVRDDEIAWYLLLAELALDDPFSLEISQAARALPFLVAIGMRLEFANRVVGLNEKLDDALFGYKANPDGTIFEILVALSYAAKGWDVEFLESTTAAKMPDIRAIRDGITLYIECKRLSRSSEYGERERIRFLEMWDGVSDLLLANKQWLWLRANFKVETSSLPSDFLLQIVSRSLPVSTGTTTLYDGPDAKIDVKHIDKHAVERHMQKNLVKMNSPTLTSLLGGDWAPPNSAVTFAAEMKTALVSDSPTEIMGKYVDEIRWAAGITRHFSSPQSIAGKARDIRKRLSEAAAQLPMDAPSVVHIAYETMDGPDVEDLRFRRVNDTLKRFTTDKPLAGVRVHMLQAHQSLDQLWDLEESVARWDWHPTLLQDIPIQVVVDPNVDMKSGRHWDAAR